MTTEQELAERYGAGSRRTPLIVGAIVVVILLAGVFWLAFQNSSGQVDADDLEYTVTDEHSVTVRYQLTLADPADVVCAVQALDEEFGVVGWKIVQIPASESVAQELTTVIPTVAEATTGLVKSCWVA